jgi:hypothetical protein
MTGPSVPSPNPASLLVKDWNLEVSSAGLPQLVITTGASASVTLEFSPEDLPELAAGLIRLADHLRRAPPCGTLRRDPD